MNIRLNMGAVVDFLQSILSIDSPTGYCQDIIAYVEDTVQHLELRDVACRRTRKGALVLTLSGLKQAPQRALVAHVDTLGAMVRAIKKNGRLLLTQVGSYAWNAVEGENVTVYCIHANQVYRGTIQTVSPSIHTSDKVRTGKRTDERMEVRLDARTNSKEETLELGIRVGDVVAFDPRIEITGTGFIKSRFLDDKAGVAVLYGVLLALAENGLSPAVTTHFFLSNYEEVGHGAATGIPAEVEELLVVDMAASTSEEHQNSDEYSGGICAKDSTGPYDLAMRRRLVELAETHHIPYRLDTYPHYGSDGSAYLRAGGDVRVGLIGPGVDASHAYERTHLDSLEATTLLALHYVLAG